MYYKKNTTCSSDTLSYVKKSDPEHLLIESITSRLPEVKKTSRDEKKTSKKKDPNHRLSRKRPPSTI